MFEQCRTNCVHALKLTFCRRDYYRQQLLIERSLRVLKKQDLGLLKPGFYKLNQFDCKQFQSKKVLDLLDRFGPAILCKISEVKWIVHPKMKIMSLITHQRDLLICVPKNILIYVPKMNKGITGLKRHEGEGDIIFIFGWAIPFIFIQCKNNYYNYY